jgi:hypothetical protein
MMLGSPSSMVLYPLEVNPLTILGTSNVRWWMVTPTGLANDTPVDIWQDGSPNANHGTASGTSRPLYKSAGLNGRPCLYFDGNDVVTLTNLIDYTTASAITVYAVVKSGGFGTWRVIAGCRTQATAAYLVTGQVVSGVLHFMAGPFDVASSLVIPTDGTVVLVGVEADFVGRTVRFQLNASVETLAMPSGSPANPGVPDNPCGDPAWANHWNGYAADVFNASVIPTAQQRQGLIDWYKNKYGLSF